MTVSDSESFAPPQKGMVRIAPLGAIPEVLREFGVDPGPLLRQFGLSEEVVADKPDATLPFTTVGSLVKACAQQTGCPHFGLLVGQRGNASTLGVVGFLLKNAPDVLTALNELVTHLDLHDRGATPFLQVSEDTAVLGYEIYAHDVEATDQLGDHAVAVAWNMMHALCGPGWVPTEVRFRHECPADIEPYRRFFHVPLKFNAEHTALVFPTRWLSQPVQLADPIMRQHFLARVRTMRRYSSDDFREQANQALVMLIGSQGCTLDHLAGHFSMHRRTLNRRLQEAGTSYRQLYNQARHELARKLLRDTRTSITAIGTLLGYADATAFNRAFSHWEGTSPVRWRKRMQTAGN